MLPAHRSRQLGSSLHQDHSPCRAQQGICLLEIWGKDEAEKVAKAYQFKYAVDHDRTKNRWRVLGPEGEEYQVHTENRQGAEHPFLCEVAALPLIEENTRCTFKHPPSMRKPVSIMGQRSCFTRSFALSGTWLTTAMGMVLTIGNRTCVMVVEV